MNSVKRFKLGLVLLILALVFGWIVTAQDEAAPPPDMVNMPGTIQPTIGCSGEWQPDCAESQLTYFPEYDVWMGTFDLPAGSYEYKVAINGSWTENYGGSADQDGPNIQLTVPEDSSVTFIYDHKTNWISDSVRHTVAVASGSFQSELGCADDFQAECMISWLQDVDGDGIYSLTTSAIPPGDYEAVASVGGQTIGAEGEVGGEPITFSVTNAGTPVTFVFDSNLNVMVVSVGGGAVSAGNLLEARAHWVTADTIAWNVEADADLTYKLIYSTTASFELSLFGLEGVEGEIELTMNEDGLSEDVLAKFPHLEGYTAFTLPEDALASVPDLLKGQFAMAITNAGDNLIDITSLQIPGVLDDLYTYDGDLGPILDEEGIPTLTVWAPTAQNVRLMLFDDFDTDTEAVYYDMDNNAENGIWSITGEADWVGKYYQYEVTVFVPSTQSIEVNEVTDPYSISLSRNSIRSQIVDLNDPTLMPEGWTSLEKPALEYPEQIIVYEMHIRDFSVFDESVPQDFRGTYMAFTVSDSNGMQHLQALSGAGLTHLHLLPSFDIATINENRPRHFEPDYEDFVGLPADSEVPQETIDSIRDRDGFNWGYDPYHYNVPEGSYATEANGPQRIIEYRSMVKAINEAGLRVVVDVVYNHTSESGQSRRSVLDKVVPGYYHRLDARGNMTRSTCCENTATEHNMMRKLMVDSAVLWARVYKVDGFRFDLMGHHMKDDMIEVRAALDSLTLENDGVDGKSIYVYGEGWNFGEVQDNARGINATQWNMAGTGIGTFNDRLRDAVRGGSPFGGRQHQSFITDLYFSPNGITPGTEEEQLDQLLLYADQIRVGLAGNLRNYTFEGRDGDTITGVDVLYNESPTGYTLDPQENIVYVSKHDNETLWDIIVYKDLDVPKDDLIRMQNLGLSIVGYSQGVPFFQAGSDMLRSKSLDRNSYNSGDWFNRLDFTYQTNNFGVGLPPAGDNGERWDIMAPLLTNEALYVTEDDIMKSVMHFREMLQIRQGSPLFHLQTEADVMDRVAFHNTGPDQLPGVIVMSISDVGDMEDLDPNNDMIVVVFNAQPANIFIPVEAVAGLDLQLHPILANSYDPVVQGASFNQDEGLFNIPARTAAVFVLPQN